MGRKSPLAETLSWQEGLRHVKLTDYMERSVPGWGLTGGTEGTSESLGVIPLSLCLNISLGFEAR